MQPNDKARTRNARLALFCALGVLGMTGAAYASVPLYRLFCQVTGFDGTVARADAAPTKVSDKTITVRFDSNVNGLPWTFEEQQVSQEIRLGETGLAFYRVTNNGDEPLTGTARYNVVPEGAGAYFQKLECFCFTEQTIQPGQTVEFPVAYFIDAGLATDRETDGVKEITLSYTFFPSFTPSDPVKVPAAAPARERVGGTARAGL